MKIGPLFKWFGSKWQNAKYYPVPETSTIIEPFAGGAGYSLNYSHKKVIIYDTDPYLIKLWPWLIEKATYDLVMQIPVNLPEKTDIRSLGLSEGQSLLLKSWQRTNSVGDCWYTSPWGNKPGQWTNYTRARIANEVEAVRHWKFMSSVWEYSKQPSNTWFIDPPYQFNYQYSRHNDVFDYQQLTNRISEIHNSCQIVVCEAIGKNGEIPSYLPFKKSHSCVTSRRKSMRSNELVWIWEGKV